MDIAELTNAPREVTLGGLKYRVRALTFAEWGELQAWIKDRCDDPVTEALRWLEKARTRGVSVAETTEATLLREAKAEAANWPPQVMTRRWFGTLGTAPGGPAEFLKVVLRPFQPSITDEQVAIIDRSITDVETADLVAFAVGIRDPKGAGRGDEPARPAGRKKARRRSRETTGPANSSASPPSPSP